MLLLHAYPRKASKQISSFIKYAGLELKNSYVAEPGLETWSVKKAALGIHLHSMSNCMCQISGICWKKPHRLLLLSNNCYYQIAADIIVGVSCHSHPPCCFIFSQQNSKVLCQGLESTDLEEQGSKNLMENIHNWDKVSVPFNIECSEGDCLSQRSKAERREVVASYL